jgi:hypothetical protein
LTRISVGDIHGVGTGGIGRGGVDGLGGFCGVALGAAYAGYAGAVASETAGDGLADAAARAGDDCDGRGIHDVIFFNRRLARIKRRFWEKLEGITRRK